MLSLLFVFSCDSKYYVRIRVLSVASIIVSVLIRICIPRLILGTCIGIRGDVSIRSMIGIIIIRLRIRIIRIIMRIIVILLLSVSVIPLVVYLYGGV